jgi:heavy metal sensor kinase
MSLLSSGRFKISGTPAPSLNTRAVRFRLTAFYALITSLMLILVGAFYRQRLAANLDTQIHDGLEQEWAAAHGYLRIEDDQKPIWYYDRKDPDESYIVQRLKRVYMLADAHGNVMASAEGGLEMSEAYQALGVDSPAEIEAIIRSPQPQWQIRKNTQGVPYLIHRGVIYDESHKRQYFLAIGRNLSDNQRILGQFTWTNVALIPLLILGGCLSGWFVAGRALTPVLEVAQAAQRISGSNLSLRIPSRGARDELDYLIETFNQMIERLENSFNQVRQFSTDVSHELRTPITAIRGQLEVALFTARTTEQYREAMINCLEDVERLSQIVRALLLLSQAESGQLALQKTQLDLAAALADVVDQFQIPFEAAKVRLVADLAPCAAWVDRIQIERMVSNLLSNALKFTAPGGEVRVGLRCDSASVEISVEDTGCGIPTDHLPHIFDRFYRVPGADAGPNPERGLGLGLSFVAWIAKAHGGTVHVDSTPGKGTRFSITLPLENGAPAAIAPTSVAAISG